MKYNRDSNIDDIGNLEGLLKKLYTDEKCGNLKVVTDGGELFRNINQMKKSDVLEAYSYRSSFSDKCSRRGHFFNSESGR